MPRQKSNHVDDPKAAGLRLREARERAGLSQRQLAFTGCTPAYISRIEAGDRIPSLQLLRELGARLGVSEDWLATGSDTSRRDDPAILEADVALRLDDLDAAAALFAGVLDTASNERNRAAALAGLGQIAFRRGQPRQSIEHLEAALDLFADEEDQRPDVADTLGRAYAAVGEMESAIAVYERFLADAERDGNTLETLRFAVLLGHALTDSGNFGRAEELLGRALAIGRDVKDPLVRARLHWSQSRLHAERNEPEIAARYARRALAILELTENTQYTARAHQLLAHIELDRNNATEALELLESGWAMLAGSPNTMERALYQLERARALAQLGRSEEAAQLAMKISGAIGAADPIDAGRSYALLAEVFETLVDTARAEEIYELAAEFLRKRNPNRFLADVYARLARLAEQDGRRADAYELMKRALGMPQMAAEKLLQSHAHDR
jgi:tetratricopeptide (TPR) repeat protein